MARRNRPPSEPGVVPDVPPDSCLAGFARRERAELQHPEEPPVQAHPLLAEHNWPAVKPDGQGSNGSSTTSAAAAKTTSKHRLLRQARVRKVALRTRFSGVPKDVLGALVEGVQLEQARNDENVALQPIAGPQDVHQLVPARLAKGDDEDVHALSSDDLRQLLVAPEQRDGQR